MPAWFIIFLFLLITGITKLYMWLGVTEPLKAIVAATLTTFVIVCGLRRSGQKQAEQKEREKAAALEKENIQPASEDTQRNHRLDADDAAFLSAVGTGLILHELHERNKEQERAERDYDGNWDAPDDDSLYGDNYDDDIDYDQFVEDLAKRNDRSS